MISREQKNKSGEHLLVVSPLLFYLYAVQTVGFIYSFPTLFYDVDQVGNLTCYGCIRRAAEGVSF